MKAKTAILIGAGAVYGVGVFLSLQTGATMQNALLWPIKRLFPTKQGVLGVDKGTLKTGLNTTEGLPPGAMNLAGSLTDTDGIKPGDVAKTFAPGELLKGVVN